MTAPHPLIEILHYVSQAFQDFTSIDLVDLPQAYVQWWISLYRSSPNHVIVETGLLLFIVWLWLIRPTVNPEKASRGGPAKLSKEEIDDLIADWQPDALVPELKEDEQAVVDGMKIIESYEGIYVRLRGYASKILNLSAFDFLGMSVYAPLKDASERALNKYGCGSCGPRGFYGTIDVHLEIEDAMARFMGYEEAILYSDGPSTVSSAIPAFAKKGDLLLVDECVQEAVRTGIYLSRATIRFFRHNDMAHLEQLMKDIEISDKRKGRKKEEIRRFVVVEGLYRTKGDLCPLDELVKLKNKYCYRVMLDETFSFGSIGATGRGVTELFNVDRSEVAILTVSMENSIGTVGGVCFGVREVVDHQRLSGAGYCFSASTPPFLASAALASLERIQSTPQLLEKLAENTRRFTALINAQGTGLRVLSAPQSPLVILEATGLVGEGLSYNERLAVSSAIAEEALQRGVMLGVNRFTGGELKPLSDDALPPTLRACMTSEFTAKQVDDAAKAVIAARKAISA